MLWDNRRWICVSRTKQDVTEYGCQVMDRHLSLIWMLSEQRVSNHLGSRAGSLTLAYEGTETAALTIVDWPQEAVLIAYQFHFFGTGLQRIVKQFGMAWKKGLHSGFSPSWRHCSCSLYVKTGSGSSRKNSFSKPDIVWVSGLRSSKFNTSSSLF